MTGVLAFGSRCALISSLVYVCVRPCVRACVLRARVCSHMRSVLDFDAYGGGEAASRRILPELLFRLSTVLLVLVLHAVVYPIRPQGREKAM